MKKIHTYIYKKWLAVMLFLLGMPVLTFAQDTEEASSSLTNPEVLLTIVLALVLIVAILVLVVALYMVRVIKLIMHEERKAQAVKSGVPIAQVEAEAEEADSWWSSVKDKLTDSVPVEEEETVMLDHDYDGIKELDNHLPPWWKGLFYFTIFWGIAYLLVFHVFDLMPLSKEEYEIQMAEAEAQKEEMMKLAENSIDENSVEFTEDPTHLENGKAIFLKNCAVCHGKLGQGGVGPNMTDRYWIHGGTINDVFKTIKYGVPQKGMVSWQKSITPPDMRDVASYLLTLQDTNPPNGKAPEGELVEPSAESGEGEQSGKATEEAQTDTVELALNE